MTDWTKIERAPVERCLNCHKLATGHIVDELTGELRCHSSGDDARRALVFYARSHARRDATELRAMVTFIPSHLKERYLELAERLRG